MGLYKNLAESASKPTYRGVGKSLLINKHYTWKKDASEFVMSQRFDFIEFIKSVFYVASDQTVYSQAYLYVTLPSCILSICEYGHSSVIRDVIYSCVSNSLYGHIETVLTDDFNELNTKTNSTYILSDVHVTKIFSHTSNIHTSINITVVLEYTILSSCKLFDELTFEKLKDNIYKNIAHDIAMTAAAEYCFNNGLTKYAMRVSFEYIKKLFPKIRGLGITTKKKISLGSIFWSIGRLSGKPRPTSKKRLHFLLHRFALLRHYYRTYKYVADIVNLLLGNL